MMTATLRYRRRLGIRFCLAMAFIAHEHRRSIGWVTSGLIGTAIGIYAYVSYILRIFAFRRLNATAMGSCQCAEQLPAHR